MVKVTMAHRLLLRFATLLVVSSFVQSQMFVRSPIRPVFFVHRPNNRNVQPNLSERVNYENSPINPNARSDLVSSEEEQDQNDGDAVSSEASFEKRNETKLPEDFDRSVRANRPQLEPRPNPPMYGDPAVMEDEDAEQDRSRFLWPFSTTVTVSKSKAHPPHHGHHHHLSHPPGFPTPPHLPPHLQHQHHHHDPHVDLEYEKTRLKYEIYKLKAKKTIAILQNKVELKKILSLLLQQKIKALEWITWYHDYVEQMYNQANGWDSGDGGTGWDGQIEPLTDEEILHSKGSSSSSSPKSSKWTSYLGGGILSRLRSSLSFGNQNKATEKQDILSKHNIPEQTYSPQQNKIPPQPQQQLQRVSLQSQQQQQQNLSPPKLPPQQTQQNEKNKPFLQNLFTQNPLLKYLGLGKKQSQEALQKHNMPFQRQEQLLRNEKNQSEEQSEEQDDEKASSEDKEDEKDDEDTNGDDDDDDDDDLHEQENEKSEEDSEKSKEDTNDNFQEHPIITNTNLEQEIEKSQEQEPEKRESLERETEKSHESEKSNEKDKSEEAEGKSGEEAEGKSGEEGNNKSEELEEKIKPGNKLDIDIDIDEELAEIDVPSKISRLRTGSMPPATQKFAFPNKKEKKKKKFQDKVYSFLFKAMDTLDKHFMSDDEEEVLEV